MTGRRKLLRQDLPAEAGLAAPGMEIVVLGFAGLAGTGIILREQAERIRAAFPPSFVAGLSRFCYNEPSEARRAAASCGADAWIEASFGGVEGALWNMAALSDCGLTAGYEDIPIRQETVEIAELFQIDPYRLYAKGTFVLAAENGETVAARLRRAGLPAAVIGAFNGSTDRILTTGDGERYMELPRTDALTQVCPGYAFTEEMA